MSRSGGEAPGRRRAALWLAVLAAAAAPAAAASVSSSAVTGIELTPQAHQALRQAQEQWLQWLVQTQPERGEAIVADLLATARQLGMSRLPDLALGALVRGVDLARRGKPEAARQALAAAERLDPGCPEAAFAGATVARLEGRPFAALAELGRGYLRTLGVPLQRYLLLQGLLLWALVLLLATGGLFIAVQMAAKGGALYRDLLDFAARKLPRPAAHAAAAALLLAPLALPYGPLWLALYWSVLLWGYGSRSERAVLAALWLLSGAAPFVVAEQQRRVAVALSPPVRAMEGLLRDELYGGLFSDLGVLQSLLPESPAVQHLLADVHRRLNQWDHARSLYRRVLDREPKNTSALLDLGAYYFFRDDFAPAIDHFKRAAASDPESAAALFDLSQAYSESYSFEDSQRALHLARELDDARVSRWVQNANQQRVVTASGGLARIPEIRRELLQKWHRGGEAASPRLELFRRGFSLVLALGLLLLAVALHLVRRPFGYTAVPFELRTGQHALDRWRRVLLPGVASAEAGEGGRSFLALLVPAALLTLPLVRTLGYRVSWGYDPGVLLPSIVALAGLAAYLGTRLRLEWKDEV